MTPVVAPRSVLALAALLAGGCSSSRPPAVPASDPEAVEQARRDERQRIMQQYWYEHTVATPRAESTGPEARPELTYPAGIYGGLRFAPRQAPDPSLGEPKR